MFAQNRAFISLRRAHSKHNMQRPRIFLRGSPLGLFAMLTVAASADGYTCQTWCNRWTCNQPNDCGACADCQPRPPPSPTPGSNPFANVDYLLPSRYTKGVAQSVKAAGGVATHLGELLADAGKIPTAVWLDKISKLSQMRQALEEARAQQHGTGTSTLSVFVVYDLPGRDCSAQSSAGELHPGDLPRYERDFLMPIAALASEFSEVPKVFILEPDSMPNLVTNLNRPKCYAAADDYKRGIARAIELLGPLGSLYVDVGWSGWIGTWGAPKMAKLLAEVIGLAGAAAAYVRGFVTNVSAYGATSSEGAYAQALRAALLQAGFNMAYIIDTSRNAGGHAAGTWCNAKGAGMGRPATVDTGLPFCDAFFWIKPPGESDGVSLSTAPRFDPECAKSSSWRGAPQAGEWFSEQFAELVQHAKPPISAASTYSRQWGPAAPPQPPSRPPGQPSPKPPPEPPLPFTDDQFFSTQAFDDMSLYDELSRDERSTTHTLAHTHTSQPSSSWQLPWQQPARSSHGSLAQAGGKRVVTHSGMSQSSWLAVCLFAAVAALALLGGGPTKKTQPVRAPAVGQNGPRHDASPKSSLWSRSGGRSIMPAHEGRKTRAGYEKVQCSSRTAKQKPDDGDVELQRLREPELERAPSPGADDVCEPQPPPPSRQHSQRNGGRSQQAYLDVVGTQQHDVRPLPPSPRRAQLPPGPPDAALLAQARAFVAKMQLQHATGLSDSDLARAGWG